MEAARGKEKDRMGGLRALGIGMGMGMWKGIIEEGGEQWGGVGWGLEMGRGGVDVLMEIRADIG